MRFESVRTIFSIAAKLDLHVHSMDVSSAFLNGDLNEVIYMRQPEGFIVPGKETQVCKLNKAIYGLKQAAKCWNDFFTKFLTNLNITHTTSDSCAYTSNQIDILRIIALYVVVLIVPSKSLNYLIT